MTFAAIVAGLARSAAALAVARGEDHLAARAGRHAWHDARRLWPRFTRRED